MSKYTVDIAFRPEADSDYYVIWYWTAYVKPYGKQFVTNSDMVTINLGSGHLSKDAARNVAHRVVKDYVAALLEDNNETYTLEVGVED